MAGSDLRDVHHAHIVFCALAGGTAHLDCVSDAGGTRGWPFALVLDLPIASEWSTMAARLLGRWTDDATGVAIRLEPSRERARVRMSDGVNAVRLDLLEVSSIGLSDS